RADPLAPGWLARNQLLLVALIIVYCTWQMVSFSPERIREELSMSRQLAMASDLVKDLEKLLPLAVHGFYSLVIVLSVIFQGSLALYYWTRRPYIRLLDRDSPPWVRRILAEVQS
ncbi:MAG TPA: hypothetical protein VLM89_17440, partial [Phycisphaerae bacterium]|nr:hypothetical protein [Phycisphaerae bacterium]